MTPLSPDSARRQGAAKFGNALRAAMLRRGIGQKRLGIAVGTSSASIANYRMGDNVPTLETAQRLAVVLDAPHLVALAQAARERNCETCGRAFTQSIGPKRYCTESCRRVAAKLVVGVPTRERAAVAERQLRIHQDAIALFCWGCEPEGLCRDGDCSLRPVSPLPVARSDKPVRPVPADRRNDAAWRTAIVAANSRRWTPEARAEASEQMRRRHAEKSPEEIDAWRRSVSVGRRRTA